MTGMIRPRAAHSPCTGVCRMDDETNLCEGCGRTIVEIAAWGELTDSARADVRAILPERLDAIKRRRKDSPESGRQ